MSGRLLYSRLFRRAAARSCFWQRLYVFDLAGAVALWAHDGTAIFFETIRTGFAACFG